MRVRRSRSGLSRTRPRGCRPWCCWEMSPHPHGQPGRSGMERRARCLAPQQRIRSAAAVLAVAAGLTVRETADASATLQTARLPLPTGTPIALTGREVEILGLLAEGLGNKTIAARLGISEHTVKTHVTSVFAKLEVSTRAEAVANAIRRADHAVNGSSSGGASQRVR